MFFTSVSQSNYLKVQSHKIAFISTIFTLENWLQIMKPLLPGGSQILNYHMIVSNFCYAVQKWTMDKILICFKYR